MKRNVLPKGYSCWLALLIEQKGFIENLKRTDFSVTDNGFMDGALLEKAVGETYQIDIAFLKEKAMEEMMEFLPPLPDLEDLRHSAKMGFEFKYPNMVIEELPAYKFIDALVWKIRRG